MERRHILGAEVKFPLVFFVFSLIFFSAVGASENQKTSKCAKYGYDYENFGAETEAKLLQQAQKDPSEENFCRLYNYGIAVIEEIEKRVEAAVPSEDYEEKAF